MTDRYILIKIAGRGTRRAPAHRLGADGTQPACGRRISGEQWALWPLQRETTYGRRRCTRCWATTEREDILS